MKINKLNEMSNNAQIVMITRYFEHVPESDSVLFDLSKCATSEELQFKNEIEDAMANNKEEIYDASNITKDILTGHNANAYQTLNIGTGKHQITGTIEYGPTVFI
jgi:hypothetical protein